MHAEYAFSRNLVDEVVDNEAGWGPLDVPDELEGVPYAPFGKGDKVGKISDFTQSGFNKFGKRLWPDCPGSILCRR